MEEKSKIQILEESEYIDGLGSKNKRTVLIDENGEKIINVEKIDISEKEKEIIRESLLKEMDSLLLRQASYESFDLALPKEITDKIAELKDKMQKLVGGE